LATQAGVTDRTVRGYLELGILLPSAFKGRRTRYGAEHLARLRAIVALRKEGLGLDAIRLRLTTLAPADLEAYLQPSPAPLDAHTAIAASSTELPTSAPWHRIALSAGVEIHIRADVGPAVRNAVQQVVEQLVVADPKSES
jgi:DNA-binding transcriptional MerR regulator